MPGGMPGGMGGMGGMGGPGGMAGMAQLYEHLMKDPEIGNLLKDPQTQQKFMAFFMSGGTQHADDPIIQKITTILANKFPGAGAGAGAGPKEPGSKSGPGGGTGGGSDDLD